MKPFPHQIEAYDFARRRLATHESAYLALSPGLGKTGVALRLARDYFRPVYVCPPSLTLNVKREADAWGVSGLTIAPDTQIEKLSGLFDLVIVDEAHRFKNPSTDRFKALRRTFKDSTQWVFMSGTPLPNSRPLDILPLAHKFAPDIWPGKDYYDLLHRYCNPFRQRLRGNRYVWNFNGFSYEKEFYAALKKGWLLRMDKSRISLPPKSESLIYLGRLPREFTKIDQAARKAMAKGTKDATGVLATYRREIGLEKAKQALPWLTQVIKDNNQATLVFCHHQEVLAYLQKSLGSFSPVTVTGGMSVKAKQKAVDDFQAGKTKLALLSIGAGGVGLNLTNADRVIILESSWLDGDNEQASDRAHRIGQKNNVLVQHVVLENSGDAIFLETALKKRDLHMDNF